MPLEVWDFALPDRLSFVPQMNAYGLPDGQETAYYRLAHEHRSCLNCLRYSWRGEVADGCAPKIAAGGSWDWTAWDRRFGPLLDGSAFADLPRGRMPVDEFYLPLNENWPMDHERAYRGGYWIEKAYPESYWAEFRAASRQLARHIAEKGWADTTFEFYLNNKVYFKAERGSWSGCSAPWIFDEPVNTQDFWALRRFGREFLAATGGARNLVFRCDISRPEWQRDLLDGVCGEEVVSGALRPYRDRILARQARYGQRVFLYGSPNKIGTPNLQCSAWCLDAWCLGADGVVPWNTIGTARSWTEPEQTCLFYPTEQGPLASLRLKAFCHGQQLVEYLTIFTRLAGHDRRWVAEALRRELGLDGLLKKTSEGDAGNHELRSPLAGKPRTAPLPPRLVDRRPETGRPQVVDPAAAVRPRRCAARRELLRGGRRFTLARRASEGNRCASLVCALGQPGLFASRDVSGAERAIETRSVSEGNSVSRPRLRFGLRCARGEPKGGDPKGRPIICAVLFSSFSSSAFPRLPSGTIPRIRAGIVYREAEFSKRETSA